MGSGYKAQPQGLEALVAQFKAIRGELDAMRKRLAALGIQVDPATDSIVLPPGRTLRIYDESDNLVGTLGADATDSSTGLKVFDASGHVIGFMGEGVGGTGLEVNRPDGTPCFVANTSSSGFFGIYDRAENYIVTDDLTSGQGLARPYIPLAGFVDTSVPTQTTTSPTFVQAATAIGYKQHPKIVAFIIVQSSASDTTGEVRLVDYSGTQVGSTVAITAGTFSTIQIGPAAISGSHEALVTMNLQIRRTAGTGTVGARGVSLWGVESSS